MMRMKAATEPRAAEEIGAHKKATTGAPSGMSIDHASAAFSTWQRADTAGRKAGP